MVITGAGSGLGEALSGIFSTAGAKVVVSDKNKKTLASVAKNNNAFSIPADVTKEKDISNLVKKTTAKFGRVDIWINNAGIWTPHALVENLDLAKVRAMIDVNLLGAIYGSKIALIQMKKQGEGVIINILSTSALEGRPGSSGYCASKYGAVGFTKSLALETKDTSIKIFAVYPGGMQTHLFDEKKPNDISGYMPPDFVAGKILENLQKENPKSELIIKRNV